MNVTIASNVLKLNTISMMFVQETARNAGECCSKYLHHQQSISKAKGLHQMTSRAQSRKHRGYKTQRNVAAYLQNWFPFATSAGAGSQGSDILNTPFDVEVKARDRVSITEILAQMESRKGQAIPIGVIRLNGMGDDASQYVALMKLGDLCQIAFRSEEHTSELQSH